MTQQRIIQDIVHSHFELDLTDEQANNIWEESRVALKEMNAGLILEQIESDQSPEVEMAENILLEVILSTRSFQSTKLSSNYFLG